MVYAIRGVGLKEKGPYIKFNLLIPDIRAFFIAL